MRLLKISAYCTYLASWLTFAIAAVVGSIPRLRRGETNIAAATTAPVVIGIVLQFLAALAVTMSMNRGPLQPRTFELAGALALAPFGAGLFVWALGSVPKNADAKTLVTGGAYSMLRNPIYLALLAMLVATGLLVSEGVKLILPVVLYLAGSELRIASEERDLRAKFPEKYARYQKQTKWRYLPGIR